MSNSTNIAFYNTNPESMPNEIWKPLYNTHELIYISNHGRIKNIQNGNIFKQHTNENGYVQICLNYKPYFVKKKRVHKMVALTFLEKPEGKDIINHLNGIKTDNHVDNLEWTTRSENMRHARKLFGNKHFSKKHDWNRRIVMETMDNNYVKTFNNLKEIPIGNKDCIKKAILNVSRSAYGFKWKFEE
jgi:hypothetical protein